MSHFLGEGTRSVIGKALEAVRNRNTQTASKVLLTSRTSSPGSQHRREMENGKEITAEKAKENQEVIW